jgi:hypothetical protein
MLSFFRQEPCVAPQLTLCPWNKKYDKATDLDTFTIGSESFTKWRSIASVRKKQEGVDREKGSDIWKHGVSVIRASNNQRVYYCYQCEVRGKEQQWTSLHGTSSVHKHLKTHGVGLGESPQPEPSQTVFEKVSTERYNGFKSVIVRWIVYCNIAFKMLENQYFRDVVLFLNKGLGALLPAASATIRNWVKEEYDKQKDHLIEELAAAISNIHLSFDIWTSPNRYSIISVFANFINEEGLRRRYLLAFRRIYGAHDGDNIAATLLEVINEYGIAQKVGYFMSDNAKNNDTAIAAVLQQLYPALSIKQRQGRRLRCMGHVINLCARALLLGKGAGKKLSELERKELKGDVVAGDRFWKGKGALGHLHNIVVYIRCTPQRLEEFMKVKKGGNLAQFDGLKVSLFFINFSPFSLTNIFYSQFRATPHAGTRSITQ